MPSAPCNPPTSGRSSSPPTQASEVEGTPKARIIAALEKLEAQGVKSARCLLLVPVKASADLPTPSSDRFVPLGHIVLDVKDDDSFYLYNMSEDQLDEFKDNANDPSQQFYIDMKHPNADLPFPEEDLDQVRCSHESGGNGAQAASSSA
jgi:hypothetical protein